MKIGDERVFTTEEFVRLAPLGLVLEEAFGVEWGGEDCEDGVDGVQYFYYKKSTSKYYIGQSELAGCWSYFSNPTGYISSDVPYLQGTASTWSVKFKVVSLPSNYVRRK